MLNYVWMFLMVVGITVSIVSGNTEEIMDTIIESANNAVTFSIGLIGVVALWCGVIKILEDAGTVEWLSKKLKPAVTRIFPSTKNNPKAQNAIVTNLTANFLGLGNGATPSGIEAVATMKENVRDVCLFLVINSAGIQLIPSTVIAIRAELGAANPTDIILPTWIVSVISLIAAVAIYAICSSFCRDRRHTK